MSISNSGASAQPTMQDSQTLVALLGSLMPLLLRIQQQGMPSPGLWPQGSWQPGAGQPPAGLQAPFGQSTITSANPTIDHQAALSLIEDINADSLRRLSTYLETHAPRHAGLEGCVPIVTQAAHCFAMRDYSQAFDLTLQAYRFIAMLQATNPQIPPVRSAEMAATIVPGTATLVH